MADKVDNRTLTFWHDCIMAFARDNYEQDGWDNFVECVGVKDFTDKYNNNLFVDFASALEYYRKWCKDHDEYRKDIYATVF